MIITKKVNYDDLRNLILLNQFYQNYSSLDHPEELNECVNKVIDAHYIKIYGKEYNNKEIKKVSYQIIIDYEE